jgi:hypothetical protein
VNIFPVNTHDEAGTIFYSAFKVGKSGHSRNTRYPAFCLVSPGVFPLRFMIGQTWGHMPSDPFDYLRVSTPARHRLGAWSRVVAGLRWIFAALAGRESAN